MIFIQTVFALSAAVSLRPSLPSSAPLLCRHLPTAWPTCPACPSRQWWCCTGQTRSPAVQALHWLRVSRVEKGRGTRAKKRRRPNGTCRSYRGRSVFSYTVALMLSDDVCQTVLQCYSLILDNYLFIYSHVWILYILTRYRHIDNSFWLFGCPVDWWRSVPVPVWSAESRQGSLHQWRVHAVLTLPLRPQQRRYESHLVVAISKKSNLTIFVCLD